MEVRDIQVGVSDKIPSNLNNCTKDCLKGENDK